MMAVQPARPMTNELTPRDDNRKRVSEILKRVDQLIKAKDYEQAQRETDQAKQIDPRNVYISAYQERISVLLEQAKKDREILEARTKEEEATRKRLEEERQKEEAVRHQRMAEERIRREEEERRRKIEDEVIRKKVEEELRVKDEEQRAKKEEEEIRRRLEEARRKSFGEQAQAKRAASDFPKVFVIDDDEKLLKILKSTIEEEQYDVFAFSTSDEAYKALTNETPDLILSDINLETSTMGGFSFYEKVRELDHLQEVPFVFLSGLSDEVLVRTGKELGIDDYVTKPFSEKHLLAVIKGKIKRYRQLRARHQS